MSRGRKWLLSAILPIESSLYRLKKVALSVGQEAENDFKVTFDNLKHRFFDFIQMEFSASPEVQKSWEYFQSPWNIAFSNSSKSHFRMVKRPEMSSKCHANPWNITFSTSPNSHFGLVKRKRTSSETRRLLETSPSRGHQKRILGFQEAENDLSASRPLEWSLFRLEKSHIFGWSISRKWLQTDIRQLESSLFRLHPNLILG